MHILRVIFKVDFWMRFLLDPESHFQGFKIQDGFLSGYGITSDMNTNLQFLPKRYNFISSYILEIMVVE